VIAVTTAENCPGVRVELPGEVVAGESTPVFYLSA
jgi:hypothetical protein